MRWKCLPIVVMATMLPVHARAACKKMNCELLIKYQGENISFKGVDIPIPNVEPIKVGEFSVKLESIRTAPEALQEIDALQKRACDAVNAVRNQPTCATQVQDYINSIQALQKALHPGPTRQWYKDGDKDGYGLDADVKSVYEQPDGYAENGGDCDDAKAAVHPKGSEVCDGLDNNCDGQVDEGVTTVWYQDADSDGYGAPSFSKLSCEAPTGYVRDNTDCYDRNKDAHPGQGLWFSVDRGDGSMDYDCDQQIKARYTEQGSCGPYPTNCSSVSPGWYLNEKPECGESAQWLDDCDFKLESLGSCSREPAPASKQQLCR